MNEKKSRSRSNSNILSLRNDSLIRKSSLIEYPTEDYMDALNHADLEINPIKWAKQTLLGAGASGMVWLVGDKFGKEFVVKQIPKEYASGSDSDSDDDDEERTERIKTVLNTKYVLQELSTLRYLKPICRHLVCFTRFYQTANDFWLVTDRISDVMTLAEFVQKNPISNDMASHLIETMLVALYELHRMKLHISI